ncbi:MAG: AbrB/MazE/SpoVT family DNA-binding domain-containing protein [Candidatus Thermoplasmatota archaeon]|nr:AbrB/MazE/SpoVT family DNA-binding domain-containing protein [Candidatus Thermoplasmatota archaeon]
MSDKPRLYGSVTVGERGQIVLPAKIREEMDITPGEKLLIFSGPVGSVAVIVKQDLLTETIAAMNASLLDTLQEDEHEGR